MNIYPILVFLHVLGAVGMFAALGIESVAVARLRRAGDVAAVRTWMELLAVPRRLGPIAMLATLATGIWMMARWWGPLPWIVTAVVAIVAMGAVGGVVSRRGMRQVGQALARETGGEVSEAFRSALSNPLLAVSLALRLGIGIGIVALMTLKPGAAASAGILIVAVVAGLVMSARSATSRNTRARSAGDLAARGDTSATA